MDNLNSFNTSTVKSNSNSEKKVSKRRSSVFYSRPIKFDECEGTQSVEKEKADKVQDTVKCASETQSETFNLEEYVTRLKDERKEWIEILKQRKIQRRNLAKQKLRLENQGQPLDLSVLTEQEREFVAAKPNYQYICRNYKKLLDSAAKVSVLQNLVYKLNRRFILQMEGRLHRITHKIIEVSGS